MTYVETDTAIQSEVVLHTDRIFAVHLPNGCDHSHFVGDPAKQHDKGVDAVASTELLTDYDRILLRFGMHILWQL